jgi:pyruvate,water dikinase
MIVFKPGSTDSPQEEILGGKAFFLAELTRAGFNVPAWFSLTADAFKSAVRDGISFKNQQEEIAQIILPDVLKNEIESACEQLFLKNKFLAVRSSAVGEDSAGASFAGQLDSFLYVKYDDLFKTIPKVWASAFSEHALAYRKNHGLNETDIRVGVVIQEMIDPDAAGVAFAVDPVTGRRDAVVISSVYGSGEGLVSGLLNADTFTVLKGEISSEIVVKEQKIALNKSGKGTETIDVLKELQNLPSLKNDEVLKIAEITRKISQHFGRPQDIEWALKNGELYVLQSRAITTLHNLQDKSQIRRVWDNSNIIESYSGVTTPLTFSFVRDVYSEVYKEFSRFMGVEQEIIDKNHTIFSMVGLIQGRIYYNLFNWYNVLSLLPLYSVNAGFMEQMMGVREKLDKPQTLIQSDKNAYVQSGKLVVRLLKNKASLDGQIAKFYTLLNQTLAQYENRDLSAKTPEELMQAYFDLEQRLLLQWRAPILNDFYTMIFFGVLKKMISALGIEAGDTLQNDLLAGEGGIISTEPIESIQKIAVQVLKNDAARELFKSAGEDEIIQKIAEFPDIQTAFKNHIDKFGSRFVNELKLETITPKQEPELLIRLVKPYVVQNIQPKDNREYELALRKSAEEKVFKKLSFAKKPLFKKILSETRKGVKNRENLRFERTRVFGIVRAIFLQIGQHFYSEHILDNPRDIFYLTKEEIFSFIDGTGVSLKLKETVALRKSEFAEYEKASPADRFETFGMVHHANSYQANNSLKSEHSGDVLKGLAACPGIVRAPVRLVRNPADAPNLDGCILVAERTDPGWAPLFPMAKGLLVERGSLLSHSAIVAREMGIPAIVAIGNLMNELIDGEEVEMNGATGEIRLFRDSEVVKDA